MEINKYTAIRFDGFEKETVEDLLIIEHPLKININQKPFTITMQTPGSELDLVRGLLFTENVYLDENKAPKFSVTKSETTQLIDAVDVEIDNSELGNGASIVRNIVSVSSCGICGKSELEKPTDTKLTNQQNLFTPQQLFNMFEKMNSAQDSFIQSGGSHACAAFDKEGKMLSIKEDVGRHNAVDKVIGNLINQNNLSNAKCLLVSGRISYEIVNKCFAAKIPILAAVSAPSSLAVDMAQEMGLTLIGFSRNNRFTVYAHSNRIVL